MTREASQKRNLTRRGRLKPGVIQEGDVEMGMVSDRLDVSAVNEPGSRRARGVPWPEGADLATQIAMGMALISGHSVFDFLLHSHVLSH